MAPLSPRRLILARSYQARSAVSEIRCDPESTMKLRPGDPWMPAPVYGRSLAGLTVNLLVRDVGAALPFHREVLGAEIVYADPDFAVLRRGEAEWMLHADHTYDGHPL